jgi:purine-binding chemotaxis protein CheW
MASDNLRALQNEALAAMQQQPNTQSPVVAALQMQLAQMSRDNSDADVKSTPTIVGEQHLVFSLLDREFAVKAELVQGVERLTDLTPVPNVASWIKGVINLRGSITSVVDLRLFLGLEPLAYGARTRLLSLQYNEIVICLIVDGVSEMLPIPASAIASGGANTRQTAIPPWIASFVAGSALLANRMIVLLDVERLLFSEKMQHYDLQGV